ncbi:hypothetical protein JCM19237_658 [Photobacterium aphoticum]|uniref:Uncharacterized protein n=1 Tax=Photobacterium aphoticum TaxID=754436 RepID=A0A090QTJ2_9GAMM|nr:hypothetical protein JCM19237_658 [Photobacterium aphoticum]
MFFDRFSAVVCLVERILFKEMPALHYNGNGICEGGRTVRMLADVDHCR